MAEVIFVCDNCKILECSNRGEELTEHWFGRNHPYRRCICKSQGIDRTGTICRSAMTYDGKHYRYLLKRWRPSRNGELKVIQPASMN